MYTYKAIVEKIIDADTMDCMVDVGFGISIRHRFRIRDYDAPETYRPHDNDERIRGERATSRAIELLASQSITLISYKLGIYGRYLADIILFDGRNYAKIMIDEGHVK